MENLVFDVRELKEKSRSAYSAKRYLKANINYNKDKVIASEGIHFEPEADRKGGIIIFSTDVNAEDLNENKLVNYFKQKFLTIKNRLYQNKKIDNIANKHKLKGWTIGRFLNGRYTDDEGRLFSEKSLSVEIIDVTLDELIEIAEELCIEFLQESVLIKDYTTNRVLFVDAK